MTRPHFTAVLEVTRTTPAQEGRGREFDAVRRVEVSPRPAVDREVVDLARLVIRADSLGELTSKLAAHVDLIEE